MFEDRRNRKIVPYVKGSSVIFNLDLGGKVQDGCVILTGNLVISGGTTNGTAIGEGGPAGLIRHITVTANRAANSRYPGDKIVDSSPRGLLRFATKQRQGRFYVDLFGQTIGNGAAGTYAIYMPIPIYFADPTSRNPETTALNLDKGVYSSVQVQVDLAADLTGCFTGNDRVIDATTSMTVQWEDQRFNQPGDTLPLYQEEHIMLIPATFKKAQDFGIPNDGAFTDWLICAEQGASQTLSDGLINELICTSDTLYFDQYGKDIKRRMYDDAWFSPAVTPTGVYYIDWTNGRLNNSNPAVGLTTTWDVNNVSGANLDQLRIFTRRILPLAPAKK